jgi:hypothetical protein
MPRLNNLLRPNIKRDKVRREYRKQIGVFGEAYLASVNGVVRIPGGKMWVHDLAGADSNGNATYGAPYQLRIKPGASIDPRPNLKVNVVTIRGIKYIESMNFDELERMGYDPHQTNALDPSLKFSLVEHLQNLQSFPNGNATVRVMPSIYRKADGTYGIFATIDEDILTGNIPSADTQVVVCLWLQSDNTIVVTVSSEETANTDLKLDTVTALTLINECAAAAPVGSVGIWSYIIWYDTTALTNKNKFHDLRGIVGGGANASGAIAADTLTLNDGSELTIESGAITVTHARHTVDTEADAGSDDLVTVTGLAAGEVCVITAAHTDRTIVVKNTGGTDISCATGADITLDDTVKAVLLMGNLAGTGVNAYALIDEVTPVSSTVFSNKTVSASANTITQGSGVIKALASGIVSAGTDRNLVIAAEIGTADDLIEVTGLSVGESVLLVADAGDMITVKHNDAGATVKIHLHGNADIALDEQNPLRLTLSATNVLAEDVQSSGGALPVPDTTAVVKGSADATKLVRIEADGISAATTRVITMPDTDLTLIGGSVAAGTVGVTDNRLVRSDGTGGNKVQGSGVTLSDNNDLTVPGQVFIDGDTDQIQLRVQGHSSQSANLATFEDDSGNVQVSIAGDGSVVINEEGVTPPGTVLRVESGTSQYALTIDGDTGAIGIGVNAAPIGTSDLIVDVVSTDGMFGLPAMTTAQIAALTSVRNGAIAYDTDLHRFVGEADGITQALAFDGADGIPFENPLLASWTALNTGSGSYDDTTDKRLKAQCAGTGTAQLRGWYTALTPPFDYRFYVKHFNSDADRNGLSIGFRQNSTGELHVFSQINEATTFTSRYSVTKWNSATSFNSSYIGDKDITMHVNWIRLVDNNTSARTIYISEDGTNWQSIHSIGRTDFLTADEIFFGLILAVASTDDAQATLLSMENIA